MKEEIIDAAMQHVECSHEIGRLGSAGVIGEVRGEIAASILCPKHLSPVVAANMLRRAYECDAISHVAQHPSNKDSMVVMRVTAVSAEAMELPFSKLGDKIIWHLPYLYVGFINPDPFRKCFNAEYLWENDTVQEKAAEYDLEDRDAKEQIQRRVLKKLQDDGYIVSARVLQAT